MHFKRRSDKGFSMMEMLGAIAIAGIIAGAAIITIPRFLGRATNSQAIAALNTAAAEALEVYSRPLPGGDTNFANKVVLTTDTAGSLTAAAVTKMNSSDSNLTYKDMDVDLGIMTATGGVETTMASGTAGNHKRGADAIQAMDDNDIWLAVAGTEVWDTAASGVSVRPAQAVRMGTASSNGATFCVILVADTSDGNKLGRGFMSVTEEDSEADSGGWAHCGLLTSGPAHGTANRGLCAPGALYSSAQDPSSHDDSDNTATC